jgi:hypothetical protein
VCMHYIHTTPAQTPKLSGPQFQTFFWGFPLYKPICFRWNLENINIYITLIFPKIFNTTQILHVFIIPCFWVFAHTGAPVALNGRWVSTSAGWARDWVLMRLLGFSYFYLVCCEHIRTVKGLHIFGTALELWKPT